MEAPDPFPPADPLGEALHFLRMNGLYYCRSELTAPWGLTVPPLPGSLWFHVVTSGRFWLETGGNERGWIQLGDLALVPDGEGHILRSEPGAPAPWILDLERCCGDDRRLEVPGDRLIEQSCGFVWALRSRTPEGGVAAGALH